MKLKKIVLKENKKNEFKLKLVKTSTAEACYLLLHTFLKVAVAASGGNPDMFETIKRGSIKIIENSTPDKINIGDVK